MFDIDYFQYRPQAFYSFAKVSAGQKNSHLTMATAGSN
jgi:hypothetical protein